LVFAQGCYCIVQYESEAPVRLALSQQNHQLGGYTLTVRPRKPITTYRRPSDSDHRSNRSASPSVSTNEEEHNEASHEQLIKMLLSKKNVRIIMNNSIVIRNYISVALISDNKI
jgi:hypothetical protein